MWDTGDAFAYFPKEIQYIALLRTHPLCKAGITSVSGGRKAPQSYVADRVRRRHHHPQPPSESKDLEVFLDFALETVNIMVPVPLQAPACLALILHVSLRPHSNPNGAEWASERRSNVNCFISSNFYFVCNIPVAEETSIRHRCSLGHSTMP